MVEVRTIDSRLARETVEREHYLHRKPVVSVAFGLYDQDELVGVCTFGQPAGLAVRLSASKGWPEVVIELNRLWVHDRMPKLTESRFVGECLRHENLGPHIVVSYADTRQGHMGIIYRALNFNYAGWTDMDRRAQTYDYVRNDGSYSSAKFPWEKKVARLPKVRYWITTGNRTERRFLAQACSWPVMDWKADPPPSMHQTLDASRAAREARPKS